jgi:exosortase family protein XrtF
MNWKEFRPTLMFLVKFLGFYLIANLVYGVYVTMYAPSTDPITKAVTEQSAWVLTMLGWPATTALLKDIANVPILYNNQAIVSVYEGCNGINVSIIFLSFLLAFGPPRKSLYWFVPAGLMVLHVSNLTRIVLLFLVTLYQPRYAYITHKYFFTAAIYGVVFIMWLVWLRMEKKLRS